MFPTSPVAQGRFSNPYMQLYSNYILPLKAPNTQHIGTTNITTTYPGPVNNYKVNQMLPTQAQMRIDQPMIDQHMHSTNLLSNGFKRLLIELKTRQFDAIRFAVYRTASKLRYIQQRTLFNFISLRQVIDVFHELQLDQSTEFNATLDYPSTSRVLKQLYNSLLTSQSNSKLADGRKLDEQLIHSSSELLFSWLIHTIGGANLGHVSVNGLKIILSTMADAKLVDKFRYHFHVYLDTSGAVIPAKFEAYMQEILRLPMSVFEGPNFHYTPQAAQSIISTSSKYVTKDELLERLLADPGPRPLMWLNIFNRLALVENVKHNVQCGGCKREPIMGLRYKCTRCSHYNLCQDCFWIGVTTDQHSNAHDVKEYSSSSRSHSRQFGHSFRKSLHINRSLATSANANSGTDIHNGGLAYKRPPLGSIFEWSSNQDGAPTGLRSMQVQNTVLGNPPLFSPTMDQMRQSTHPGTIGSSIRSNIPITSIQSPIQQRRIPQMNPHMHSASIGGQSFSVNNPLFQPLTGVHTTQKQMLSNPTITPQSSFVSPGPTTLNDGRLIVTNTNEAMAQFSMLLPNVNNNMTNSTSNMRQPVWSCDYGTTPSVTAHQSANQSIKAGRNVDPKCREEHQLIAKYAAQLASEMPACGELNKSGIYGKCSDAQQQLLYDLQSKNTKIIQEIERLQMERQQHILSSSEMVGTDHVDANFNSISSSQRHVSDGGNVVMSDGNSKFSTELDALRQKKDNLEARMSDLQRNRAELTLQLETLVQLLSSTGTATATDDTYLIGQHSNHQPRSILRPVDLPKRSSSLSHDKSDRFGQRCSFGKDMMLSERIEQRLEASESANVSDIKERALMNPCQMKPHSPMTELLAELKWNPSFLKLQRDSALTNDRLPDRTTNLIEPTLAPILKFSTVDPKHPGDNNYTSGNRIYAETGSDAYLYSDPEVGGINQSTFGSITRPNLHQSLRRPKQQNRPAFTFHSNLPPCSDNYEYPGLIRSKCWDTEDTDSIDLTTNAIRSSPSLRQQKQSDA